jgi:flagellar biosynthesis GTPase FlhF
MVQGQLSAQVPDFATLRPVSPQPVSPCATNAATTNSAQINLNEKMVVWNDAGATNTIVTVLGHVYHHAKITLVEPDGVTIKYTPDEGGFGGIKIPFEDLPLECRQQYGYDPQKAIAYVEAKEKKEEQQKQAAQQAEAKQAQQDYEQAKADYEQAKEEFDAEIKIQTLRAQQQIADAQSKAAQQAALQTRIMRAAAIERQIQEQQKLWEMQSQTYQQQRIADQINDLNWQLRMLMLNR